MVVRSQAHSVRPEKAASKPKGTFLPDNRSPQITCSILTQDGREYCCRTKLMVAAMQSPIAVKQADVLPRAAPLPMRWVRRQAMLGPG